MSPTASTSSSVHTAADGLPVQLISRVVAKKVKSIETAEGEGALVRRSIGTPALRDISPFLMLDHFDMAQGSFPAHPHRGMTTVTMMLNGYVQHEDFMGNAGIIGPGSVQVMTAGKGIMHAEFPLYHDPKTGEELSKPNGLQLWIDLPAASKFTDPIYQDINATEMATAEPRAGYDVEREGQGWEVRIIAGKSHDAESPVRSPEKGECWYFDITLQPGGKLFQPLPTGWNAFSYILPGGNILVGEPGDTAADSIVHTPYHTLVLSNKAVISSAKEVPNMDRSKQENGVWLRHAQQAGEAGAKPARFVLVAGQPLDQQVFWYGPFVLATKQDLQQTLLDFQLKKNGFEKAAGWVSNIEKRARSHSFS